VSRFLETGIPVGLGTDSLASNTTLSLWDEMRFARDTLRMDSSIILSMSTLGGAKALGLDSRIGSLDEGKEADMIAVSAEGCRSGEDPVSFIVEKGTDERIMMVMVAGKEI
jgi:cytosine/adenosine deaminase-related metal-dependent hydrolase